MTGTNKNPNPVRLGIFCAIDYQHVIKKLKNNWQNACLYQELFVCLFCNKR